MRRRRDERGEEIGRNEKREGERRRKGSIGEEREGEERRREEERGKCPKCD